MKLSGVFALILSLSAGIQCARADSIEKLIEISSDAFPGSTYHFAVGTDAQGDVSMFSYSDGGTPAVYSVDQVRAGVVLFHNPSPSRDVIIMKLDRAFSGKDGGKIEIDFLVNGLLHAHRYGRFDLELVRNGTTWLPYALDRNQSRADHPFSHMKLVANRFLGHVVGVSKVQSW